MPSHRINLRGPWDYRWLSGQQEPISVQGTVSMPCEWRRIFGDASGLAEFGRKFHKPTNLEPHEIVTIVLTEVSGCGHARLNGVKLGEFTSTAESVQFEITDHLKPFNELKIEVYFDPSANRELSGGLYGIVAIHIASDS